MDSPGEVTPGLIRQLYDTNVVGLVRTMHAFLPLLSESASPVVVNVGSSLGSLGRVTTAGLPESGIPAMAYGSSKAAVTMITVHYAKAYPRMRINCVDPGYAPRRRLPPRGRGTLRAERNRDFAAAFTALPRTRGP